MLLAGTAWADPDPALYERAVQASLEVLEDDRFGGSGFIIDPTGLAITAAHVVNEPHRRLEVRSPAAGRLRVQVLARDVGNDVALLQLPPRAEGYPTLPLAKARPPVGAEVYLLGAPLYQHAVLLSGRIARQRETFEYLSDEGYYLRTVHLSAPSPVGTSGGPWMNWQGQVVGLQSGLMKDDAAPVGIAYMAPLDALLALVARGKNAQTMTIRVGFEEMWEQPHEFLTRFPQRTEGVVAARVRGGGPGALAGLKERDVVTHVDAEKISLRDEMMRRVRRTAPGATLRFTVLRPGEAKAVSVVVAPVSIEPR
jgi:serine protease Do